MGISYSSAEGFNVAWIVSSIIPFVFMGIFSMFICFVLTKKAGVSKAYTLLGLLGMLGIFICYFIVIIKGAKNVSRYHRTGTNQINDNTNPYAGNANQRNYDGSTQSFVSGEKPYISTDAYSNSASSSYANSNYAGTSSDCFNTGASSSGASLNTCRTHEGRSETYDSVYGQYDKYESKGSYNLNGEIVNYDKNICHHCGDKVKPFATYCETCGSRV